ncbi:MAG: class I SAM-dependent methyltransferase [Longicatena sp.]
MMYETLAHFYDALVSDEEATSAWVALIERNIPKGKVMELACGSGEITIALAQHGYEVHANDISESMIEQAKLKHDSDKVRFSLMDMCQIEDDETYDGVLCLCDSFNYILEEEKVEKMLKDVVAHLKEDGTFIMDMHSLDRLVEFKDIYEEAGNLNGQNYQWTIESDDDYIYQTFAFYDESGNSTMEYHVQRVYDPLKIKEMLIKVGFEVHILTDFDQEGICAGEKQFYICKKVNK